MAKNGSNKKDRNMKKMIRVKAVFKRKENILLSVVIILIYSGVFTSYELYEIENFEEKYFVEVYLIAEKKFIRVLLSKTSSFDGEFTTEQNTVKDADDRRYKLDQFSNRVDEHILYDSADGIYRLSAAFIPQPRFIYELQIIVGKTDTISAFATVPDTFRVAEIIRDKVTYLSSDQVEVNISQSWYPGRQNIYIFTTPTTAQYDYPMTPPMKINELPVGKYVPLYSPKKILK